MNNKVNCTVCSLELTGMRMYNITPTGPICEVCMSRIKDPTSFIKEKMKEAKAATWTSMKGEMDKALREGIEITKMRAPAPPIRRYPTESGPSHCCKCNVFLIWNKLYWEDGDTAYCDDCWKKMNKKQEESMKSEKPEVFYGGPNKLFKKSIDNMKEAVQEKLMKESQMQASIEKSHKRQLEIIKKKNGDYANREDEYSNFRVCQTVMPWLSVEEGIIVRMLDKLVRLANLAHYGTHYVTEESRLDTCDDLANYANILKAFWESQNNAKTKEPSNSGHMEQSQGCAGTVKGEESESENSL